MPRETRQQRLAQAANRWDMAPRELEAFAEMTGSAPWARVEAMLAEEKRAAEHELRSEDNMPALARAQGKLEAVERVKNQIRWIVESYKEAMRDDTETS